MGLFGKRKSASTGIPVPGQQPLTGVPMLDQQQLMMPLLHFTAGLVSEAEWQVRRLTVLPTHNDVQFFLWQRDENGVGTAPGIMPPDIAEQARALQRTMYQRGSTWITAEFEVTLPQGGGASYNYDEPPIAPLEFTPVDAALHLEEFPRDEHLLPDWLRDLAARA